MNEANRYRSKALKVFLLVLVVSCVASYGFIVNASSHSTTLGTPDGSLVYKSTDSEQVNPGAHTCHYNVTSFSFHGGMPINTFPAGNSFTIRFANIGVSKTYTKKDTSSKSNSYSVSSKKTVYAGVESTYTHGLTVYLDWNPNW